MDEFWGPKSGRARVLVVEDSPTQLEELRFVLEDAGLEVIAAANGREGLEAARANAIDLVITDIVMPEMDGYELSKALREDKKLRRLPVILLTSLSDPLDVIRGLESGADNFLRKPFEAGYLLARIRNILGTAQLRRTAGSEAGLTIRFRDKDYYLGQERLQLLDALLSAFDDALCLAPSLLGEAITGSRVLVIEDSPTEAERLRSVLTNCGCEVVSAANGREGLEACRANPIDLVISDVIMPEMDGYELCRAIRADEKLRDMPVVLVSALADPQDLIAGLEAGATHFIRKPINDRNLSNRIGNLLAVREARGDNGDEPAIDILYEGQQFSINADRMQILDLLVSNYEDAVHQNAELARTRDDLQALTQRLEVRVAERTATLKAEIEQRKRSEKKAAQSAREWQQTFDTSASAIWVLDKEGRVIRANKPTERFFGSTGNEIIGRYSWEIVHGGECDVAESPTRRAQKSLHRETAELHRGDVWLEVVVDPIVDSAGLWAGATHVVSDITARKQAESSLRLTQFSVDHAADSIFWSNSDGRLVAANESLSKSLGYGRDELLTMTIFDLDPSLSSDQWSTNWERVKVEGTFSFEAVHRTKDGKVFPVDVMLNYVAFEDQELNCAFVRDITDRERAKKDLSESELKFRTVANAASDWTYWVGSKGEIIYCSPSAERITGYRAEDFLERPSLLAEIIHPEDRERESFHFGKTKAGASHRAEYRIATRAGEVRWIDHLCQPVVDDEGVWRGRHASNRDITEEKLAQEALEKSELRYRTLLDTMLVGFAYCRMLYDDEGRPEDWVYLTVNEAFNDITGLGDVVGKKATEVIPTIREASPELFEIFGRVAATGSPETFEIDFAPLSMRLHVAVTSFESGYFTTVFTDETERRKTEEQLRQSQKMEAVGQLAGGIAHDFNNLLTAILGYSDLVLASEDISDSPAREDVLEIRHAAERAGALTRQILAFSRRQPMRPIVISLNEVLTGMEPLLRRTLGENIDLATLQGSDLDLVEADLHQFEQLLMNLAVNARDAMPVGGRLTLETSNVALDDEYCRTHPDASPGSCVMLSVSDNGVGMDETVLKHIFEPFFTTKAPGEGTGLGLAMVYGIVKQSGGSIFVYSEPGKGTSFKIYLPRVGAPAHAEESAATDVSVPTRGEETVLVVEDESAIRTLVARVLGDLGYRVFGAETGQEALEIVADMDLRLDLLVTDLVLPGGIQGKDVADVVHSSRPDLPVLFMSGYTRNAIVHAGRLDRGVNFLEKPFTPAALAAKVREVLGQSLRGA